MSCFSSESLEAHLFSIVDGLRMTFLMLSDSLRVLDYLEHHAAIPDMHARY